MDLLARPQESIGHADVENARFAATTYAAIGMTDKAVEQVVAPAPADLDGLIELTSLLGRLGRAVALLQYEIENTNDPALLSTAISGL